MLFRSEPGHDSLHHDPSGEFVGAGLFDETSEHSFGGWVIASLITGEGEQTVEVFKVGGDDRPRSRSTNGGVATCGALPFGGQGAGEAATPFGSWPLAGLRLVSVG